MVKVRINRPQEITLMEFLTMYANQAEKDIEELTIRLSKSDNSVTELIGRLQNLENGGM